ncbi:MAG: YmdB family metallophosphoesterase [Deltaproteobacteria bacterium]|jgi:metallophosphoesterase (TIGR00282 family)|nr:YmdB family metallophosphoesterase [Deltaproteobacteria bacterium]
MRVLFLGDVFALPGREIVRTHLPGLVEREGIDLVLANGENASGGKGLLPRDARALYSCGIAALSGGNHSFQHKESSPFYDEDRRAIRPANYPDPCPGRGWTLVECPGGERLGFGNIMGRTFIPFSLDCPFKAADRMLDEMSRACCWSSVIDFHAEATAEKKAMAFYLDGRVGALLGTHTHVQTSDAQILPGGTAYLTDAGMTGPHGSVIGMDPKAVLKSFILGRRHAYAASKAMASMQGAIMEFGGDGRAVSIRIVNEPDIFGPGLADAREGAGEGGPGEGGGAAGEAGFPGDGGGDPSPGNGVDPSPGG